MALRTIYEGGIAVDASDYVHGVERGGDYVDEEIGDLDVPATRVSQLRFTLDYPFDKPYEGLVIGDAGVTLRQMIDGVRRGFRIMYRGALHQEIPNVVNELVDGDYGRAYHAIGDLVIESLEVDEESGVLEVGIGS